MTQRTQFDRAYTTGQSISSGQPEGTPFVNFPDLSLQVQGPSSTAVDLLAVRLFSDTADYAAGDIVAYQGSFYAAAGAITAGPWSAGEWNQLIAGQFDAFIGTVDWNFTISYDVEENPEIVTYSNGVLRVRLTTTYTAGDPTSVLYETSTNSGTDWTTAGTLTITYTDSNPTGGTWS
jgi:hypothetical protein